MADLFDRLDTATNADIAAFLNALGHSDAANARAAKAGAKGGTKGGGCGHKEAGVAFAQQDLEDAEDTERDARRAMHRAEVLRDKARKYGTPAQVKQAEAYYKAMQKEHKTADKARQTAVKDLNKALAKLGECQAKYANG